MVTDMKKLVKDWFVAWNSGDAEKLVKFYTDDCLYEMVARGAVYHGKNELATYYKNSLANYTNQKLEQKATFYSENAVCGEFVLSGTQVHSNNPAIPAGKTFSERGAYISEWQNGKVKRHSVYTDYLTIMQQLGQMPASAKK
jgi:steroid delta-isomerase-like uncharacterized protein